MTVKQFIPQPGKSGISESSILLTSFIAGFVACILTVSILFFTVKKIESKLFTFANITDTAKK